MKMTIGEVIEKLDKIDAAVRSVRAYVDHNSYDSLEDAAELLQEYRDMIYTGYLEINQRIWRLRRLLNDSEAC